MIKAEIFLIYYSIVTFFTVVTITHTGGNHPALSSQLGVAEVGQVQTSM